MSDEISGGTRRKKEPEINLWVIINGSEKCVVELKWRASEPHRKCM